MSIKIISATMLQFTMLLKAILIFLCIGIAHASIDVRHFDDASQENRYNALIHEFRCPKCQNQNLAGSDAPIAVDLKNRTYELIMDGQSDTQIRTYMKARYGDFISYDPPVRPSTWILWYFPPLLLIVLILAWLGYHARKQGANIGDSTLPSDAPDSADDTNNLDNKIHALRQSVQSTHTVNQNTGNTHE